MTVASATVRMGSLDIGFPPHGALCIRNGAAAGRLLLHGTVNPIPALRGGMPPLGATGKNRAAAADLGRNGPGLGEACEGDRSGRLLFATLIGMLLWHRAPAASAAIPVLVEIRRRAISRIGRRWPCPSTPLRSDDSRPIGPCGSCPCAGRINAAADPYVPIPLQAR